MRYLYSVVRFVPDPARGEFVNVGAIAAQRQLLTQFPDSAKAPDALLNIASAQSELGDLQGSRATMQEVVSKYPASEAGVKAKQRLGIR